MKKHICYLFLFISVSISAQTYSGTHLKLVSEHMSLGNVLSSQIYDNPANQVFRFSSSMSTLKIGYEKEESDNSYIMQHGRGDSFASFNALSYIRLDKESCVWGEARYNNGLLLDVKWNENSDYDKIFPYVSADTIGGNLNYESYFFKGGYAVNKGNFSVGVQMVYSSSLHFRQKDPRPKDNSVLINASTGINYCLPHKYALGISLFTERYTQNQSFAFLDPLGSVPVYHMSGMGLHYVRFAGTNTDAIYKGRTYSSGITLKSYGEKGWDASLKFENYKLQKLLPSLSNAPLNDILQNRYEMFVAWKNRSLHFEVRGSVRKRYGSEHIYDDGTKNWHEISCATPYSLLSSSIFFSMVANISSEKKWNFEFMPELGYLSSIEQYYPSRDEHINKISTSLVSQVRYVTGRHLITARIVTAWGHCLSADQNIENPEAFVYTNNMIKHNFDNLSSDLASLGLYLQYNIQIKKFPSSVFGRIGYDFISTFKRYTSNGIGISIGFTI